MNKPYCPYCKKFLADEAVTFDNRHAECGSDVQWMADESPVEAKVVNINVITKRQKNELIKQIIENTPSF